MSTSKENNQTPALLSEIDYTTLVHIDGIQDNTGTHTGLIDNNGLTDDLTPTLVGRLPGADGLELRVYANGSLMGYSKVDSDGNWSFTPETPLKAGIQYDFQVFLLDPGDGNTLWPSNTYTVHTTGDNQDGGIPDTPPDAPVIDSVADDVKGGTTGALHNGDVTNDTRPAISGHAEAGATINIYDNGVLLGSTTAAADGSWSFTPATALKDGEHNLTASAVNAAGESVQTGDFSVTVDTLATKPIISGYHDDLGSATGTVGYGGLTDDNNGLVSGHAEAGSVVKLTMWGPRGMKYGNVGSAVADSDGNWHIQLSDTTRLLGNRGNWTFQVTAIDEAGNSAASDKFVVKYVSSNHDDTSAPDAPTIVAGYDDVGSSTGSLNSGATTDDTTPKLSGHAEAGSIVKIYDNGALIGSTTANSKGDWSFTPSALSESKHAFSATATDATGKTSDKSGDFELTIDVPDTSAPDAPTITTVYDDVGILTGNIANGDKTDDSQLKITGTAEANSTVVISHVIEATGQHYVDGSVVADAQGNWTFQMTDEFQTSTYGNRIITATATDAAGNTSVSSAEYVVNFVASNQDSPYSSGLEQFGDASNEQGYSFVTAQGVEVTSTTEMWSYAAPTNFTNRLGGNTYLFLGTSIDTPTAEVHITLPGIADTVTISCTIADYGSVTFYNAAGEVIEVTSSIDSNYGNNVTLDLITATAVNGEAIASFTLHDAMYIGGVQWSSPLAPTHTLLQEVGDSQLVNGGDDSVLLSQVDDKSHPDITDHQHNTLKLSLDDILSEAHDNLFIQDGHKQLAVTGDAGDVVELKVDDIAHDWQDAGQVTAGGVQYEVYQHADTNVELLVQHGVELHQVS